MEGIPFINIMPDQQLEVASTMHWEQEQVDGHLCVKLEGADVSRKAGRKRSL